jgi:hypothetical protein
VVRVTSGLVYLEGDLEYRTGAFWGLPNEIKKQIPELEAVTQVMYAGGAPVRILDSKGGAQQAIFKEDKGIAFLEPGFFEVFDFGNTGFSWLSGDPQESLGEPFSVVLIL